MSDTAREDEGDDVEEALLPVPCSLPTNGWPKATYETFWAQVNKTTGCWYWTGRLTRKGYGEFSHDGIRQRAHRFSWEEENGPIPGGLVIDHLCFTKSCVRPSHCDVTTVEINSRRAAFATKLVRGIGLEDFRRLGRHSNGTARPLDLVVIPTVIDTLYAVVDAMDDRRLNGSQEHRDYVLGAVVALRHLALHANPDPEKDN